jgi:uncharacterized protein with HEPN domain
MFRDDAIRLRHMLDAAREAIAFTQNRTRVMLDNDRMLTLSLVKSIEIIGEAAARVSHECQERYPAIPWASIIAMRNRPIHAHFDVDLDRVWDTIMTDLPPLITDLEKIVLSEDLDI